MVDTHIHGFYNHSTTDNEPRVSVSARPSCARRGTTSWLPTTFTDGVEQIKDACAAIAPGGRCGPFCGARIQGITWRPLLCHEARGRATGLPFTLSMLSKRSSTGGRRLRVVSWLPKPWRPSAWQVPLLMRLSPRRQRGCGTTSVVLRRHLRWCIARPSSAGAGCCTHIYNGQRCASP